MITRVRVRERGGERVKERESECDGEGGREGVETRKGVKTSLRIINAGPLISLFYARRFL